MPVPFALMAVGTGLQIAGQWSANLAQAKQEAQNAQFYKEQAEFARLSEQRAQAIAEFDYTYKIGQQVGNYAASGVDMSGSASITMGGTIANYINEAFAIKKKGELDFKLAMSRSKLSSENARTLSSVGYNLMQSGGSLIKAYGASEGFGQGFPDFAAPESPLPSWGDNFNSKYFGPIGGN